MADPRQIVIVTGSGGFIGGALVAALAERHLVVGLDRHPPPDKTKAEFERIDLTSGESVRDALSRIRKRHWDRIASVIHLAAYFDLTGEPNPNYQAVTVEGTGRLLDALQEFRLEQFLFVSTMLVHQAARPGELTSEERPLDPKLPHRASKVETERLIHERGGAIPAVCLRPAGVYDDRCRNAFLARQIGRIYERSFKGHVYPGDLTGQSFLHLDDLVDAVLRTVDRRRELPPEVPILLGEPDVMGYGELQSRMGRLIRGEDWETWQVPKPLARAGAWVEEDILGEEPFIRPWMVDIADDHYALDVTRARTLLGWIPQRSLRDTLPRMIEALKADPFGWYKANKLNAAKVAGQAATREEGQRERQAHMQHHMGEMAGMRRHLLWVHFLVIALGAWLLTSPLHREGQGAAREGA